MFNSLVLDLHTVYGGFVLVSMVKQRPYIKVSGVKGPSQGRNQLSVLGGRASKFPPNNFILQLQ